MQSGLSGKARPARLTPPWPPAAARAGALVPIDTGQCSCVVDRLHDLYSGLESLPGGIQPTRRLRRPSDPAHDPPHSGRNRSRHWNARWRHRAIRCVAGFQRTRHAACRTQEDTAGRTRVDLRPDICEGSWNGYGMWCIAWSARCAFDCSNAMTAQVMPCPDSHVARAGIASMPRHAHSLRWPCEKASGGDAKNLCRRECVARSCAQRTPRTTRSERARWHRSSNVAEFGLTVIRL